MHASPAIFYQKNKIGMQETSLPGKAVRAKTKKNKNSGWNLSRTHFNFTQGLKTCVTSTLTASGQSQTVTILNQYTGTVVVLWGMGKEQADTHLASSENHILTP